MGMTAKQQWPYIKVSATPPPRTRAPIQGGTTESFRTNNPLGRVASATSAARAASVHGLKIAFGTVFFPT